jgi:hypothetical protein
MALSKREVLRNLITAAVARVDRDMLTRVWNEMDYRIDSAVLPKVDASVKYVKKNLENFSLYGHKKYHDPLRSLFVANFLNVSQTYE